MTEYIPPPHVMSVLKTYQDKAPKSLHGPGLSLVHPSKSAGSIGRSSTPEHGAPGSSAGGGHHHHHHHDDERQSPPHQQQRLTIVPSAGLGLGGPPPPILPPVPAAPIMTTPDPDCGIVNMTVLEGKRIGCFLLGGEMRLCLPQIFNNILMDFSVEQINRSIQELMIYLYNCTDQQLQEFKRANIIPDTAKTCGLITRTNAERLCSSLLHQAQDLRPPGKGTGAGAGGMGAGSSFRVYHRCFGKCEGILTPELYSYDEPACIECCECHGMYSPQKFVCHQHEPQEIRTCHWGFDSSYWRLYIHVLDSDKNREEHTQILKKIWHKEREIEQELAEYERELWIARRKIPHEDGALLIKNEPQDIPLKKPKLMGDVTSLYHSSSSSSRLQPQHVIGSQQHHLSQQHHQQTSSAFRPWAAQKAQKYAQQQQQLILQQMAVAAAAANGSPYANGTTALVNGTVVRTTSPGGTILALSQEPPLLQNPENVVPMSETDKFERSYQPNVALAPRKSILCKESSSSTSSSASASVSASVVQPAHPRDHDNKEQRSVIKCEVQIKQENPPTPPPQPPLLPSAAASETATIVRSVIKCDVQIKQERPGTPPPGVAGHLDGSPPPPAAAHIPVAGSSACSSPPPPPPPHVRPAPTGIAISTIIAKQQQQQRHVLISSMAPYGSSGGSSGSQSNSPVTVPPPDGHSGSNEITSSTSPLPPPINMSAIATMNGGSRTVVGDKRTKLVLIKEPLSPPLADRTSPLSLRHSPGTHQQHVLHQQQQRQSPPSPPHHVAEHHQPVYLHHHPHHHPPHHHHHHPQQQQQQSHMLHHRSHHGPPAVAAAVSIIHKNGVPVVGNSEFELSTDTDDDSQAGEPDSSNGASPIELISEVLKDVEPKTRQQILDLFKVLVQENRMVALENQRLQLDSRAKDDQLLELHRQKDDHQQQLGHLQQELNRAVLKIEALRLHSQQLQLLQQHQKHVDERVVELMIGAGGGGGESSTSSSTPPSPLSLVSNGSSGTGGQLLERRNSFPEKSEIIMKPLKKLLRRSPDDTAQATATATVLMLASPPAPAPSATSSTTPLPPPVLLPAGLSITAATVKVPSQHHLPETEAAAATDGEGDASHISPPPSKHPRKVALLLSSSSSGAAPPVNGSSQSPTPPPPQPPPSASNVPVSPTTIAVASPTTVTVASPPPPNGASLTKCTKNPSVTDTPGDSAAGDEGLTLAPTAASRRPSTSPRPSSRPSSGASGGAAPSVEEEPTRPATAAAASAASAAVVTITAEPNVGIGVGFSGAAKAPIIIHSSSSSSKSDAAVTAAAGSNQENDSPNRTNGNSSDSNSSSSTADN